MAKKIFVGNLSWGLTNDELKSLFEEFGMVEDAFIITDRETRRSKGFGFVTMTNDAEADAAIDALNGSDMKGRPLVVNEARPQEESAPRRSFTPRTEGRSW
ncbi:MAG: RNA-binding protein [Candidatus Peregrinibacteria bacterium]